MLTFHVHLRNMLHLKSLSPVIYSFVSNKNEVRKALLNYKFVEKEVGLFMSLNHGNKELYELVKQMETNRLGSIDRITRNTNFNEIPETVNENEIRRSLLDHSAFSNFTFMCIRHTMLAL